MWHPTFVSMSCGWRWTVTTTSWTADRSPPLFHRLIYMPSWTIFSHFSIRGEIGGSWYVRDWVLERFLYITSFLFGVWWKRCINKWVDWLFGTGTTLWIIGLGLHTWERSSTERSSKKAEKRSGRGFVRFKCSFKMSTSAIWSLWRSTRRLN